MNVRGAALALFLIIAFLSPAAWPFHDATGQTRCLDCHLTLPFTRAPVLFRNEVARVCVRCHRSYHGKSGMGHPVEIAPSMEIPADMPLDLEGKLTCITCHAYHTDGGPRVDANTFLLRRPPGMKFCYYCHRKQP